MRRLFAIFIFPLMLAAQGFGGKAGMGGSAGLGGGNGSVVSLAFSIGGAAGPCNTGSSCPNSPDTGDNNTMFGNQVLTPNSSFTLTCCTVGAGSSFGAGTTGIAFYTDKTSGCQTGWSHCPDALVSGCNTTTSTGMSQGLNTITVPGGCSLSQNTRYWLTMASTAGSGNGWATTGATNTCPTSPDNLPTAFSSTSAFSGGTFPSTFGALLLTNPWWTGSPTAGNGNGCYEVFGTFTYNVSPTYNIVTFAPGSCDTSTNCPVTIPSTGSNQTAIIYYNSSNSTNTLSSIIDCTTPGCSSTVDTFTQIVTGVPTGSDGATSYLYYGAVSSGIQEFNCKAGGSSGAKPLCVIWIIAKNPAGTLTVDKSCIDSAAGGSTSYTSCSTGATTQAVEFGVGALYNQQGGTVNGVGTVAINSGLTLEYTGGNSGSAPNFFASGTTTYSSTGAKNFTATITNGGGSCCSVAGLMATFK